MNLRHSYLLLTLFCSAALYSTEHVSLAELQNGGWERLQGQEVCITTPLVVCGTFYDSVTLAPERLFVPEERAIGLADGDSTEYYRIVEYNRQLTIKLECPRKYDLNLGATVTGLRAHVTGLRSLQSGRTPRYRNYRPCKRIPSLGKPDILVCSANIQNYFVHLGGYATKRNTAGQHALQRHKTASALCSMKADLYAICEIEKGPSAPAELTAAMNDRLHKDIYDFVRTDVGDGDTISCGFIDDTRTLRPFGDLRFAYPDTNNIYHCRFMIQGFEDTRTSERFVVSLNHLRSKRGTPEESTQRRNDNAAALLQGITDAFRDSAYTDPDILLLGDYNSYSQELPLQTIVRAGFGDVLLHYDSLHSDGGRGYSYSYKGECGYLDRVFASPSMAAQITDVRPLHWNTDYYYSAAYYSKYNFRGNNVPQDEPHHLRRILSRAAKRNLLFRYADHDPVLVGLKLSSKQTLLNSDYLTTNKQ